MIFRKCVGMVLAVLTAVSCTLPAAAMATVRWQSAPSLSIAYNGKTQAASRNTFHWDNGLDNVSAEGQGVLTQGRELPVFTRVTGINTIGCSFSYKPKTVTVNRWAASDRGNLTAQPTAAALDGGMIRLPSEGAYIYEVVAQWDEGDARFAFEVTGQQEDGLSAFGNLPADYTAALASAAADVTIDGGYAENLERLTAFIAKMDHETPAVLRISVFEEEAPPLIYELHYDGKQLRCFTDTMHGSESGQVTSAYYDGLFLENGFDPAGVWKTLVKLRVGQGKRVLCGYRNPTVFMRAISEAVTEGSVSERVELVNNGTATVRYDSIFYMEKLTESGWKLLEKKNKLPIKTGGVLEPGGKITMPLALDSMKAPLTEGTYRVGKKLLCNGVKKTVYTELQVYEQRLPFHVGNPQSIQIVIGSGGQQTAATLTRRGKYGGNSPLVYAVNQLAKPEPLPRDARLIFSAGAEQASLVLIYADGSTRNLRLDPNAVMELSGVRKSVVGISEQGREFVADRSFYDALQQCTLAVNKAARY